jgi:hypothetical protein
MSSARYFLADIVEIHDNALHTVLEDLHQRFHLHMHITAAVPQIKQANKKEIKVTTKKK